MSAGLAAALEFTAQHWRRMAWLWALTSVADLGVGIAAVVERVWWLAVACALATYLASNAWGRAYTRYLDNRTRAAHERRSP